MRLSGVAEMGWVCNDWVELVGLGVLFRLGGVAGVEWIDLAEWYW